MIIRLHDTIIRSTLPVNQKVISCFPQTSQQHLLVLVVQVECLERSRLNHHAELAIAERAVRLACDIVVVVGEVRGEAGHVGAVELHVELVCVVCTVIVNQVSTDFKQGQARMKDETYLLMTGMAIVPFGFVQAVTRTSSTFDSASTRMAPGRAKRKYPAIAHRRAATW